MFGSERRKSRSLPKAWKLGHFLARYKLYNVIQWCYLDSLWFFIHLVSINVHIHLPSRRIMLMLLPGPDSSGEMTNFNSGFLTVWSYTLLASKFESYMDLGWYLKPSYSEVKSHYTRWMKKTCLGLLIEMLVIWPLLNWLLKTHAGF